MTEDYEEREWTGNREDLDPPSWPIECAGCLFRVTEYAYEIGENIGWMHSTFSGQNDRFGVDLAPLKAEYEGKIMTLTELDTKPWESGI